MRNNAVNLLMLFTLLVPGGCKLFQEPADEDRIEYGARLTVSSTKTGYWQGEAFDAASLSVKAEYPLEGKHTSTHYIYTILNGYSFSWNGGDLQNGDTAITAEGGTKTITVNWRGHRADFSIFVFSEDEDTSISVTNAAQWADVFKAISDDSDGTGGKPKVYRLNIEGDTDVPNNNIQTTITVSGSYKTIIFQGTGSLSLHNPLGLRSTQAIIIDGPVLRDSIDLDTGTGELRKGTVSEVYVREAGTFTMRGGTISDSISVRSDGSFTMLEGSIRRVSIDRGSFTMSGGTISGSTSSGVYVGSNGNFTMSGGTIKDNSSYPNSGIGGGVLVNGSGTFNKTGGIIYGDDPNNYTHTAGSETNTATLSANVGKNGHAVIYQTGTSSPYTYYYRNETLDDTAAGNISTLDTMPDSSGATAGKWTMR